MTRHHWRLVGAASLLAAAVIAGISQRRPVPSPGSLGDVFDRIRVGMSQREAVAILDTLDRGNWDCVYYAGTTRDGQPFRSCVSWVGLPAAEEIETGEIELCAEQGGSVCVSLGRGGVVTGKRLVPEESSWLDWLRSFVSRWAVELRGPNGTEMGTL